MPSVQSFMVPAELCITCYPQDKCKDAIAAMVRAHAAAAARAPA